MKLTVTPLERQSPDERQGLHYHHIYAHIDGCFVQTLPNTGAIFGQTNNVFGGTLS